jgi:hypothetical protein
MKYEIKGTVLFNGQGDWDRGTTEKDKGQRMKVKG